MSTDQEGIRDSATGQLLPGAKLKGAGRPKGSRNKARGPVGEALDEKISVEERGRRRRRTKRDLAAVGAVNDALMSKDARKLRILLDLEAKEKAAAPPVEEVAAAERLTEIEQQILLGVIERMRLVAMEGVK
jgi:hypothetical protein